MSRPTGTQLAETFKRYRDEGWGYVWGAQGETYTKELAEAWHSRAVKGSKSVPSGRNRNSYYIGDCSKWIGRKVADCSGGIVAAIREFDPGYADRSSSGFKAQFTESGKIGTLPEIPGLALWKSGHIGLYIGNGKAIEFRGTAYGCVETAVKDRTWTHWGKIKGVTYGETASGESAGTPVFAVCSGGSVNVRSGPGSSYNRVGVLHKGDRMLVNPGGGWPQIAAAMKDGIAVGYMAARYIEAVKHE